jgi:hypothetical protein
MRNLTPLADRRLPRCAFIPKVASLTEPRGPRCRKYLLVPHACWSLAETEQLGPLIHSIADQVLPGLHDSTNGDTG